MGTVKSENELCKGGAIDKESVECRDEAVGGRVQHKACIPPLLQVMINMNNVKKVFGITRVKRLGGKVKVIH